jgi:ribonuclease VapC
MVVDSSALLAILLGAPQAHVLLEALVDAAHPRMSTANWLEVAMLIEERGGRLASLRFDEFFRASAIELTPVDAAQAEAARTAWRYFGRHKHSARLSYTECFAYALAKSTGQPLLFCSEGFARTDIVPAIKDVLF